MLLDQAPVLAAVLLLVLTATAAITDERTGLIPNWLTLPAFGLALLLQLALGGPQAALLALGGSVGCGVAPLVLFGLRAMGGGDVKLLGALGALCGASLGLEVQLGAYVIAAVLALPQLARRGALRGTLERSARLWLPGGLRAARSAADPDGTATEVRLGLPVFLATLAGLVRTWAGSA